MPNAYEIDVHPTTGQPVVLHDLGMFGLGCKPKISSPHAGRYPPVESAYPLISRDQWTEQDLRPFTVPILNQGQTRSCGPHALVEAMGCAFALAGDERPLLSPWWVYGELEHGRDDGTALPDLLHIAETMGVPLAKSIRAGDFSGQYPQSATTEAKRFRIETAYDTPTFDGIASALERNHVSVIGVDIGQAFEPDSRGVLPEFQQGPQVLGHALSVCGKKLINSAWHLLIQNHWGQWGMGGFAWMPASYIQPAFGAWSLRIIRPDPNDPNNAPAGA